MTAVGLRGGGQLAQQFGTLLGQRFAEGGRDAGRQRLGVAVRGSHGDPVRRTASPEVRQCGGVADSGARTDDVSSATQPPVLVVMGVSGSGKSTVGALLAGGLGWDFEEGDDLHPAANVAKMSVGHPLDDEDRWPWLARVGQWIVAHTSTGRPGVITCSALKRSYRDLLRGEHVVFVYLAGTREQIASRLVRRHGHFMSPSLLDSQFDALEVPTADEKAVTVDIGDDAAAMAAQIMTRLNLAPSPPAGSGGNR